MKITLVNPNVKIALGFPATETFELTRAQLSAWNRAKYRLGGITFNEAWNESQGLPCVAARAWLNGLHSAKFGVSERIG